MSQTCFGWHRRLAPSTSAAAMGGMRSPWRNVEPRRVRLDFAAALLNRALQPAAERGTRFGFFDMEDEHAAVLREAARVVRDGGLLLLKVVNGAPVIDGFRATEREERDGVVVSGSNSLAAGLPRLYPRESRSAAVAAAGSTNDANACTTSRSCGPPSSAAGFEVESVFAGSGGAPFDPQRHRLC